MIKHVVLNFSFQIYCLDEFLVTWNRASVVVVVTNLRAGRSAFRIHVSANAFLFSKTSRQILGLNQPPVKWEPEFFPEDEASDT